MIDAVYDRVRFTWQLQWINVSETFAFMNERALGWCLSDCSMGNLGIYIYLYLWATNLGI
jgi:hypothetical protein